MNKIELQGIIKNIELSHKIGDVEYYKANLLVTKENGKEDLLNLKFKRFSCNYNEGDKISLIGNIRTYSQRIEDKNKVEVYVFTYFDKPEDEHVINKAEIEGTICKSNGLRQTRYGKDVLDFILLSNINGLCSYIPCVAWGKDAKLISKMNIGDQLHIEGQLVSREYKKMLDDKNFEIKVAHEVNITNIVSNDIEI